MVSRRRVKDRPSRRNAGIHIPSCHVAITLTSQVWDGISGARITFSAAEMSIGGQSIGELSRLTENLNLQRALLRQLESNSSIELVDKVKVESITSDNREGSSWPLLHLSDGRVIRARLLVRRPSIVSFSRRVVLMDL